MTKKITTNADARRRGRGEGSITELPNGRFLGRVTLSPGVRRSVYADTRTGAYKAMREALGKADRGQAPTDARQSVGTFLATWLDGPARARLRPTAWASYASYTNRYLIPALGRYRLARLTTEDVDLFLAELAKPRLTKAGKPRPPLSPRTREYIRAILRSALTWAVKHDRVPRNVAKLSDAVTVARHEIEPLTAEQARALVEAARNDPLGALFVTALDTGARQGELLALRWSDVDVDKRIVRITRAAQRVNKATVMGPPKSDSSRRIVTFTQTTERFLRELRTRQKSEKLAAGKAWQELDLVFASATGAPLVGSTCTKHFQAFLARTGLPRQRFHDLRHASGSFLLAEGMPIKLISERLGHAQIAMTLRVYTHLIGELQGQAADAMEGVLAPRKSATA